MTTERLHRCILADLHRHPGSTALELATRLGLRVGRARDVLDRLQDAGATRETDGEWYVRGRSA